MIKIPMLKMEICKRVEQPKCDKCGTELEPNRLEDSILYLRCPNVDCENGPFAIKDILIKGTASI